MSTARSRHAYPGARSLLDLSISNPNGTRTEYPTLSAAMGMRHYCYTVRNRQQAFSRRQYEDASHPAYDTSPWDMLTLVIRHTDNTGCSERRCDRPSSTHWLIIAPVDCPTNVYDPVTGEKLP